MTISPGIHPDMPAEEYHAVTAFSASTAATLLTSFPARLLEPWPDTTAMEDGRIAHRLVLEGVDDIAESGQYIVVPSGFSMSHVKKHAELIERIEAEQLVTISETRAETIRAMHKALLADPMIARAFTRGRAEVSVFWHDPDFGFLSKARFDWLPDNGEILPDYKTCASIDDAELGRAVKNYQLAHRTAHYEDAARIACGMIEPRYVPVWCEKKPPYWCVMRPVDEFDVDLARLELRKAKAIYADCIKNNHWPGPKQFQPIELPGWERKRLEHEYRDEMAVKSQETMKEPAE